ncbi:uncharacterized protein V2V93DRAFT_375774 [Kockiozyma suomiensis]|uniref:uncharacterized protein n=1 Tax=Kockiozyma suomiensis TaxID=1337062 RepID=UPI0033430ABD
MNPLALDAAALPSIIFTTAAQLVDCVDRRLLVVLRDGRKLIGILRSFDQYANLVLQDTVERIVVGSLYNDQPRGVYIIRGENVVLVGQTVRLCLIFMIVIAIIVLTPMQDPEKEATPLMKHVSLDEIFEAQQQESDSRRQREELKNSKLIDIGFSIDSQAEDMY